MSFLPRKRKYLTQEQEQAVVAAIQNAERENRGEVRVHLEARCKAKAGALARAEELFGKLNMANTAEGTAVLLYVAIDDHVAAVFAGAGIHGAAAPGFWQEVIDRLALKFAAGDAGAALADALDCIGDLLREKVPGEDLAGDELPNEVSMA